VCHLSRRLHHCWRLCVGWVLSQVLSQGIIHTLHVILRGGVFSFAVSVWLGFITYYGCWSMFFAIETCWLLLVSSILTVEVSTIHCPERTCGQVISYNEIRLIVKDADMMRKYEDFTLQQALDKMTDLRYCSCFIFSFFHFFFWFISNSFFFVLVLPWLISRLILDGVQSQVVAWQWLVATKSLWCMLKMWLVLFRSNSILASLIEIVFCADS
jgi:hypothetical protein